MNKLSNDEIYQRLMRHRKEDPKNYACNTIAIIYGDLKKRINDKVKFEQGIITSKKFKPISDLEIKEMREQVTETISRMVQIYGLCQKDVDLYNTWAVEKINIAIR